MNILHEVIPQRLWTAFWAMIAAVGGCFIYGRMSGVFYSYLMFDLLFSLYYVPALLIGRRIENWSFFLITAAWLVAGWFLAGPATQLVFD